MRLDCESAAVCVDILCLQRGSLVVRRNSRSSGVKLGNCRPQLWLPPCKVLPVLPGYLRITWSSRKFEPRRAALLLAAGVFSCVVSYQRMTSGCPNEYWISPDVRSLHDAQVGHGPFRQRSPIPSGRITLPGNCAQGAVVDLHEQLYWDGRGRR